MRQDAARSPVRIPGNFDLFLEIATLLFAGIVLPFYLGLLESGVDALLAYCLFAGPALATAECLDFPPVGAYSAADFLGDALHWGAAISGIGVIFFLIARIIA